MDNLPVDALREAVTLVDRKFWKQLETAGLERIDPVGTPFDPTLHEAVAVVPPPSPDQDHLVGRNLSDRLPLQGRARPSRAGAGLFRAGSSVTWPRRTFTRSSAFPIRRARRTSRRPTGGSPSSTTRMPTRTTPRQPSASRRFPRRIPSSPTARSARSTIACDATGRSTARLAAARGPARRWPGRWARALARRSRTSSSAISAAWVIFFRPFSAGAAREEPVAETLETVVEIPFRVAVLGGKVPVTLAVTEILSHLPGVRRRTGSHLVHLSGMQWARNNLVRPGRLLGQSAVPHVSRPGQDPVPAVPYLRRCGGGPDRAAGGDHRSTRHGNGLARASPRPGTAGAAGRSARRSRGHLPGAARSLLPPRRARHRLRGDDQRGPGGTGHAPESSHHRRQEGDAEDSSRYRSRGGNFGSRGRESRRTDGREINSWPCR